MKKQRFTGPMGSWIVQHYSVLKVVIELCVFLTILAVTQMPD